MSVGADIEAMIFWKGDSMVEEEEEEDVEEDGT